MEQSIRSLSAKDFKLIDSLYEKNRIELEAYADFLIWWNTKLNLVSRDVSRETVLLHVKHSLFVSFSEAFLSSGRIIDTGAGGGLPGIPLAICFPEKEFVINDIVTKKIFAVNDMINKLNLRENVRGEAGDIGGLGFDGIELVITKHAFKIDQLYKLIKNKPWKNMVFLKGCREAVQEVEGISAEIAVKITRLDSEFMPSFYAGKGLVEVERVINE